MAHVSSSLYRQPGKKKWVPNLGTQRSAIGNSFAVSFIRRHYVYFNESHVLYTSFVNEKTKQEKISPILAVQFQDN